MNTASDTAEPYAAMLDVNKGTVEPIRKRAVTAKAKANTNSESENFVTRSRNRTPMMRGVIWALASWTTRSRDEQTKTMNVKIAPASAPMTMRIASGSKSAFHPSARSTQWRSRTATSAVSMATHGRTQIEFR